VTLTRSRVAELLRSHDLRPKKSLGQHFLVDPNTARRIVRLAGVSAGDRVVEIGPGVGSLTVELLDVGASVLAVELDPRLAAVLAEVTEARCEIVVGDALEVDLVRLCGAPPVRVVANLPYNVAVPIIMRLLNDVPAATSLFVMVQAEVADRLAAGPGNPAYGAVSVKVAYLATAALRGQVPRTVFAPEPNVDSSLISIERRTEPAVDLSRVSKERLFEVVTTSFSQRRKMLRRSLAGVVDDGAFERAGVQPTQRPEELDVGAFGRLAARP
jgi:16S rRNA (adenine1518-N6/adenine1519-N6)-dimethyltransferase